MPIMLLVIACALDVAQLAFDQGRLWHAAREGARVAAVVPDESAIRRAVVEAGAEDPRIVVAPEGQFRVRGEPVTVVVRRDAVFRVPLLRPLLGSVVLTARATFRVEEP
jgi:hypothetical protein